MSEPQRLPLEARDLFASHITRYLEDVARGLHELADEIERRKDRVARIGQPGTPTAGTIAGEVYSRLANTLPNLPISGLINAAADYDSNL